jgi:hypothetical protein
MILRRETLLERNGEVIVDNEPLAVFVLPYDGPAESTHFDFAGFGCHLAAYRGRRPNRIAAGVNGSVIVQGEYSSQLLYFRGAISKKVCGPEA